MKTKNTIRKQLEQKTAHTVARITFKARAGYVLYLVRSSNGVDLYQTTLVNGKATGCTCPSRKPCYHCTDCEKIEAERTDRQQIVASVLGGQFAQDLETHVEDSIASGEFDWIDEQRAAWANATPEQRRAMYSSAFDLSYGDVA